LYIIKAQKFHGKDKALTFYNFKVGNHRHNLVQEGVKVKNIFLPKNSFFAAVLRRANKVIGLGVGGEGCMSNKDWFEPIFPLSDLTPK